MILTNDLQFAENIRKVQSLGYSGVSATKGKITKKNIQDPLYSRHISMGWNYRMPELCCAVALAQVERMNDLIEQRIISAKLFTEAVSEFSEWFTPQYIGPEYKNSYWTWVAVLKREDITWHSLRDKFLANGGDGVYAAWQLTYLEPMFKEMNLLNREKYISKENKEKYKLGLCPNAEWLQPRLFQFKTNYWDISKAKQQAEILYKTLKSIH
jgi:perosamine synthetase